MKSLLQSIHFRASQVLRRLTADTVLATAAVPVRSGWPPLSTTPAIARRNSDAGRWLPRGPRNG